MKTIKLLFFLALLIISSSFSYGQSWDWGRQGIAGTKYNDFGSPVATDKFGNAYIAKQYISQISFGTDTLRTKSYENMYFVKYNSAGTVQWAKQPYSSKMSNTLATGVATDTSGNIFVTGFFADTVKFGSFTLFSNSDNAFLVKYSGTGNVIWAVQTSPPGGAISNSVCTDKNGNSYTTGFFAPTVNIGPYRLTNVLTTKYVGGVFIAKYDRNGNVLWARQSLSASSASYAEGNSITADKSGNIYVTGYFVDTISFGSQSLYSNNAQQNYGNIFLVKYDSNGNLKWVKQSGYASKLSYGVGFALTTDRQENPYVAGYFKDTVTFGTNTLIAKDSDMFLVKYDTSGNVIWAEQSAEGRCIGYSLSSDADNNVYLGGIGTSDTLKFGGSTFYNIENSYTSFILKLTTSGNVSCGSMLINGGGNGTNYIGIASDSTGQYIYMSGTLYDDSVFCASDTLISSKGGTSPYVARWKNCGIESINTLSSPFPSLTLFPNPSTGTFTLQTVGSQNFASATIEIYNVLGQKVETQCIASLQTIINLTNQPNGIYLYRVLSEDGSVLGRGKIIVQK